MKNLSIKCSGKSILVLGVLCLMMSLAASCTQNQAFALPPMVQMLPANYYDCIEMTPYNIIWSYFDPYGYRWRAEEMYTGKVIVFKDIEVTQRLLDIRGEDFIWCDQVRCFAVNSEETTKIKNLKLGQKIDVVGVMRGVDDKSEYLNTIKMTECYFAPAGSWGIPIGGSTFVAGY